MNTTRSPARRWAVFLDRDGVLTDAPIKDGQPRTPTEANDMLILPNVVEAIDLLRSCGALLFVVTNQPDVSRGLLPMNELDEMHRRLAERLDIDEIVSCTHDRTDRCPCRKPLPGMILDLANRWTVSIADSYLVGDRWVDVAAGSAAGTVNLLVDRDYSWNSTSSGPPPPGLVPDHRVDDVLDAARRITTERHTKQVVL